MTIAVNANFLNTNYPCYDGDFIFEIFSRLAKKYPQHNFIYFFDNNFDEKYITSKNITTVITGPQIKNPLLLQYRLNYKIPSLLKKHKADIFISAGGYCSLRTKLPQCVIINDLSFLQLPQFFSKRWLNQTLGGICAPDLAPPSYVRGSVPFIASCLLRGNRSSEWW